MIETCNQNMYVYATYYNVHIKIMYIRIIDVHYPLSHMFKGVIVIYI